MRLVIVTGLSGSGKSIALHTLEDLGYYCIDNLPMFLLPRLAEEMIAQPESAYAEMAVGMDARGNSGELLRLPEMLRGFREHGVDCTILCLEAQDETLIRRYSETRRRHPLSDQAHPLADAIRTERELLEPLFNSADLRIDTSHTTQHQLRDVIRLRLGCQAGDETSILIQSFGYKHGVPRDADFVFDVRCLVNPHWVQELRPLTGRDGAVAEYLQADSRTLELQTQIEGFLDHWLGEFARAGRGFLTIAFGCTGGQHRSVYIAERVAAHLRERGSRIQIRHRELSS